MDQGIQPPDRLITHRETVRTHQSMNRHRGYYRFWRILRKWDRTHYVTTWPPFYRDYWTSTVLNTHFLKPNFVIIPKKQGLHEGQWKRYYRESPFVIRLKSRFGDRIWNIRCSLKIRKAVRSCTLRKRIGIRDGVWWWHWPIFIKFLKKREGIYRNIPSKREDWWRAIYAKNCKKPINKRPRERKQRKRNKADWKSKTKQIQSRKIAGPHRQREMANHLRCLRRKVEAKKGKSPCVQQEQVLYCTQLFLCYLKSHTVLAVQWICPTLCGITFFCQFVSFAANWNTMRSMKNRLSSSTSNLKSEI